MNHYTVFTDSIIVTQLLAILTFLHEKYWYTHTKPFTVYLYIPSTEKWIIYYLPITIPV